jgi:hypothetical protein
MRNAPLSRPEPDMRVAVGGVLLIAVALAAGLAVVVTAGGCRLYCTLIGWTEGLAVTIRPDAPRFAEGVYRVEVVADGEAIMAEVSVEGEVAQCSEPPGYACHVERAVTDGRTLRLDLWMDPGADAELALSYAGGGGPAVAVVRVLRDGVVIGEETFEPQYTREEINGPGCGVATRATAEMVID